MRPISLAEARAPTGSVVGVVKWEGGKEERGRAGGERVGCNWTFLVILSSGVEGRIAH